MVVALATIPSLVRHLGTDRFGILTIGWAVLGYFSLFDLGLGRALTQLLAERLGREDDRETALLTWTGLFIMLGLGILGGGVGFLSSSILARSVLHIPAGLQTESIAALQLISLSLPAVILTTGLIGILAAVQRFDILNKLRIPQGIFSYFAPYVVVLFRPTLPAVLITLLLGRTLFCVLHLWFAIHVAPQLKCAVGIRLRQLRPLLSFGGWMTVSNVIGPVMTYFDRFLIGIRINTAAVAYYTTPYEIVNRLLVIPASVSAVAFPAVSNSHTRDGNEALEIFSSSAEIITAILFPIMVLLVLFANEGMRLWLGDVFAAHSGRTLQLLAIGMFLNGGAQIAFAVVQGAGRADLTAKFHLLELPLYLGAIWYLLPTMGGVGAALAWLCRALLDMVLLFAAVHHLIRSEQRKLVGARLAQILGFASLLVLCMFIPAEGYWKFVTLLACMVGYSAYGWRVLYRGLRSRPRAPFLRTRSMEP